MLHLDFNAIENQSPGIKKNVAVTHIILNTSLMKVNYKKTFQIPIQHSTHEYLAFLHNICMNNVYNIAT
uniref:Uncharacterized protein n=1 Tax=Pararge aegeria TaxID=116150 RepID=S4NZE3_9NEOP